MDSRLLTSDPHISAIGDCAMFPHPRATTPLRIESVQNAVDQARLVADRLTGTTRTYDDLPWFWSTQFSATLQIAGLGQGHDAELVVGEPDSGSFSVLLFRDDRLIAVESVGRPADHMAARRLLAGGIPSSDGRRPRRTSPSRGISRPARAASYRHLREGHTCPPRRGPLPIGLALAPMPRQGGPRSGHLAGVADEAVPDRYRCFRDHRRVRALSVRARRPVSALGRGRRQLAGRCGLFNGGRRLVGVLDDLLGGRVKGGEHPLGDLDTALLGGLVPALVPLPGDGQLPEGDGVGRFRGLGALASRSALRSCLVVQDSSSALRSHRSCSSTGREATSAWCWKVSRARRLVMSNRRATQA